jgi:hypothetical protein
MKPDPHARGLPRIRVIALCLAVAGMAGAAFRLGEFLAARIEQIAASQTTAPQAPKVNFGELMAAAR